MRPQITPTILPILSLSLLLLLCMPASPQPLLQQTPLTFSLLGNISYTPTSGGVNIPGYILKLGFYRYSWIAVKFMTPTSRDIYDIVVVRRDTRPVGGYYRIYVADYYVTVGRQGKLLADTVNNMDKQVEAYTQDNYFQVELYRTKGTTQGQDWEGGQFVKLCFLTSDGTFDQNSWTNLHQSCYGYDVDANYISTFMGKQIGSMNFDGLQSPLYGGIDGPLLEMKLFWYCKKATLSSNDVYIRIGDKISQQLGYDYFKCNSGDYFGPSTASLTPDTLWSGYNDGECTITSSSTSNKISYSRIIYTNDQFDSTLYQETKICVNVGGGNEQCSDIKLELLFPVMDVESALVIWGDRLRVLGLGLVMLALLYWGQ